MPRKKKEPSPPPASDRSIKCAFCQKELDPQKDEITFIGMGIRHRPIREQGVWLGRVLAGYFQYFAIPGNIPALGAFRDQVIRYWHQSLRRRGQRHRLNWQRFGPLVNRDLPHPRVLHPHPTDRFYAKHPK